MKIELHSKGNIADSSYCDSNHLLVFFIEMAKKKSKLDKATERTAEILRAHLESLPIAQAKAMRKDLHRLAVKSSRSANRETTSISPRSANPRPLSRASAKLA